MKNIKIQIIGESGSGKSLINSLILKILLENGFDVKFNETLEDENFDKFERVRNNCLIDLEVVQAKRNIWENCKELEGLTLKDEWIDKGILESALDEEEFDVRNKKQYIYEIIKH